MNLAGQSAEKSLAIAIMDNFMEGSTDIDRSMHTTGFSERLKNLFTKKHLKQIFRPYRAEWGYCVRKEWIAVVRGPSSVAIL